VPRLSPKETTDFTDYHKKIAPQRRPHGIEIYSTGQAKTAEKQQIAK